MDKLFQVIEKKYENGDAGKSISLGIQARIGHHASSFPVTAECRSVGALAGEVKALKKELDDALEKGKALFRDKVQASGMEITDEMAPENVWLVLSAIRGEEEFVGSFNALEEQRRQGVAEFVLTSCNIFAGKAAIFSARYDSDTALLE